jgi:predicted membrane metal-binding protein
MCYFSYFSMITLICVNGIIIIIIIIIIFKLYINCLVVCFVSFLYSCSLCNWHLGTYVRMQINKNLFINLLSLFEVTNELTSFVV